jgi:hypothetical protein
LTSALPPAVIDWVIVFGAFVLVAFVVMLILLLVACPATINKIIRIGISAGIVALIPVFENSIQHKNGKRP